MNNKNIVVILVILAFSFVVIAGSEDNSIAPSEPKIQEITHCSDLPYDEDIYGICTGEIVTRICDDPPQNLTCHDNTEQYNYTCVTGTRKAQSCATDGYIINNAVKLDTQNYECSTEEIEEKIIIICDSKFDGNGDGKCTSGESCMKFVVDRSTVQRYEKNSKDEFTETDKTFFLDRASAEVLE